MRKYIFAALILITAACSSDLVKNDEKAGSQPVNPNPGAALEKVINASLLEVKGEYEQAIKEYQDALLYDRKADIYYLLAKDYYRLNKLSPALTNAQKSVELDSLNTEYLNLLGTVYEAGNKEDSAAAVYSKIITIDSTDITAYYNLAQIYSMNKPSEALKLYNRVINLIGPEWNVLVKIAEINERMGNEEATLKSFEELLKLNPSNLDLQKFLIETYIKRQDYEKALAMADEALSSFPDDLNLIQLKASCYVQMEEWKNAADEYLKVIKNNSIPLQAKFRIGAAFMGAAEKDSTNLDFAKQIFTEINQDTLDWQVNAYLGEIAVQQKDDSLAIGYFKKAASLAEWNTQIWTRLGGLLFDKGKYKEAVDEMKIAAEKFPNDFVINLIYGLSLSQQSMHEEAKTYLMRAYKINPDDITVLSALGFTLNQLKDEDNALIYLNRALDIDSANTQVIGIAALIYDGRKEFIKSDALYERALRIDSTDALLLNNYAYSLSERGLQLQRALAMVKKSIEKDPSNSSYLDTEGWIYYQLGDFRKAKEQIEKSLELDDKSWTVLDHLGDVYNKLGIKTKALEYWKKALSIEPGKKEIQEKIEKADK